MREKMTHFSREIARNARNDMYQFLALWVPDLTKIWAIFSAELLQLELKVVSLSYLIMMFSFLNFEKLIYGTHNPKYMIVNLFKRKFKKP